MILDNFKGSVRDKIKYKRIRRKIIDDYWL